MAGGLRPSARLSLSVPAMKTAPSIRDVLAHAADAD